MKLATCILGLALPVSGSSPPGVSAAPPLAIPGASSGDEAALALERPGDGSPVCGLGQDFHVGRRAALRAELEEGLVVLRGLPTPRDYRAFRQDKTFWYLTGIESPNAALLMDCESGREVLFLSPPNARDEAWNGERWDTADEWIAPLTGFGEIQPSASLLDVMDELLADSGSERIWISRRPFLVLASNTDSAAPFDHAQRRDVLDGRESRERALEAKLEQRYPGHKVRDLVGALDGLRLRKTPAEIAAMRRAAQAGAVAMAEAMRSTRPGLGEWDVAALLDWIYVREGAAGSAYDPIVGSGPNSLVLHYMDRSRRMQAGEVLLVDAAPEVDHFTSDITRTWPVSGRFTERQAEIYDAVLAAQAAGIAAVKPGATMEEVNDTCVAELLDRGFPRSFILHGTCHWIGMEVHDVGAYRAEFEPGMAFTIEPGLYEPATGIGVRIEDVVVVTETGCEVISAAVPRGREAVEALVRERGILDAVDSVPDDPSGG